MAIGSCCDEELGWIQTAAELLMCADVCASAAAGRSRKECVS